MTIFLTIIHVIVCFVLILVILLQAGRGQGLGGATFGSGNVQSLFGTRAGDFLTKATTVSAICFILTCIGLDFLEVQRSRSLMEVSQKSAPVNLEQIREALEKVKGEMAAGEGQQAAMTEAAADLQEEAAGMASSAEETVEAGAAAGTEASATAQTAETETAPAV